MKLPANHTASWLPQQPQLKEIDGLKKLRSASSPATRFLASLIFALFWNLIVGFILFQQYKDFSTFSILVGLFLIPSTIIGMGAAAYAVYKFLGLFLPRPLLLVEGNVLSPGQSARMEWRLVGAVKKVARFSVDLVGEETAIYSRGTSTFTDRSEFYRKELVLLVGSQVYGRGNSSFQIPEGSIHSFNALHNKITWKLHVKGELKHSPDINEEFILVVLPA